MTGDDEPEVQIVAEKGKFRKLE